MANNKTAVRQILDKVKAEGRTSLTAPEGKLVCDAYGIAVPKEGVATTAADAAKIGLHVDDDQGGIFRAKIAIPRPGVRTGVQVFDGRGVAHGLEKYSVAEARSSF